MGNNNVLENIKRKYKKISQVYDDLEFFSLSIEPCYKKSYVKSPPGFSHEELYPNDKSGDNFNYQLYLRPQLLFYLQIAVVVGASFIFIFSGILRNAEIIEVSTYLFIYIFINVVTYYIAVFKYFNTPVLYSYWGAEANKHLKYWFRQVPQQIKLKKESDELWFKGRRLKKKTSMYSSSYNKLWSANKQVYYICLSDILLKQNKNIYSVDKIIYLLPVFPTVIFLFLIVLFDSVFIASCDHIMFSIAAIPIILYVYISSLLIGVVYKNKAENAMFHMINNRYENRSIPSYFMSKMPNNNIVEDSNDTSNDISDFHESYLLDFKIKSFLFSILLVSIIGLANIKSMLYSKECNDYTYQITIKHNSKEKK